MVNTYERILSNHKESLSDIHDPIQLLTLLDSLYYNDGRSLIGDMEYDVLRDETFNNPNYTNNIYFAGVGSPVRLSDRKLLPFKLGSLDQIHEGDLESHIAKTNLLSEYFVITEKLDGVSCLVIFNTKGEIQIAFTRGDGIYGSDITRHVSKLNNLPHDTLSVGTQIAIRGELIISESNFKKWNSTLPEKEKYKNARNAVAGLINSSDPLPSEVYKILEFVAYEWVNNNTLSKTEQLDRLDKAFDVVEYQIVDSSHLHDKELKEFIVELKEESDYALDGIVIDIDSPITRSALVDVSSMNPKYTFKYKMLDENAIMQTTIIGMYVSLSKHRKMKPVILIDPVDTGSVVIKRVNGLHMSNVIENRLMPGTKVDIIRAGDVIPQIHEVVDTNGHTKQDVEEFMYDQIGKQLGLTRTDWTWDANQVNAIAHVTNDDIRQKQVVDFFTSLKIDRLKAGSIKKLFDSGFDNLTKIITATENDFEHILGKNGIVSHKSMIAVLDGVDFYKVAGATTEFFGHGMGVRKFKKLQEALGEYIILCEFEDIIKVQGFDQITAEKIYYGMGKFLDTTEIWEDSGVLRFNDLKLQEPKSNFNVVITGTRDAELQTALEDVGASIKSSVSKNTDVLIHKSKPGAAPTGKLKKALGLDIHTVEYTDNVIETIDNVKNKIGNM